VSDELLGRYLGAMNTHYHRRNTMSKVLDRLTEQAKEDVELIYSEFEAPDDDLIPYMLMATGQGGLGVVGLDPEFFSNEEAKNLLAYAIMPEALREFSAQGAAFVSAAWTSDRHRDDPGPHPLPRDDPNRREAVFALVISATEARTLQAEVTRTDDAPPVLGDWVISDSSEVEGRFARGMRQGLAPQG
jgi:hypothetical protein